MIICINNNLRNKLIRSKRGFSLPELLIGSSLGLMLLMAVMSVDVFAKRNYVASSDFSDLGSSARNAMDWISKDIRSASQILLTQTYVGGTNYQTGDSEIVLQIPSITSTGDILSNNSDIVIYSSKAQANQLRRILVVNAGMRPALGPIVVTNFLKTLSFSSGGQSFSSLIAANQLSTKNKVEVSITLEKQSVQKQMVSQDIKSEIRLRNK